jgi:hypothetical protein
MKEKNYLVNVMGKTRKTGGASAEDRGRPRARSRSRGRAAATQSDNEKYTELPKVITRHRGNDLVVYAGLIPGETYYAHKEGQDSYHPCRYNGNTFLILNRPDNLEIDFLETPPQNQHRHNGREDLNYRIYQLKNGQN